MLSSKVTRKGQTTLPRKVREALHLKGGDRLSYEMTEQGVLIRQHLGVMAVYGSIAVPDHLKGADFEQARRAAWEAHTAEVAHKGLP